MNVRESDLRLYAVTDRSWLGGKTLTQQVEEAIKGGATCVQLREKELAFDQFLEEARCLKDLCQRYQVPFIVNDSVEIAMLVDADGVHVGQEDMLAQDVRRVIGPDKILGVTAKTVKQAITAQAAGADYLGSGAVFGSATKTNAKPMSLELLKEICGSVSIPVVAIGGICLHNLAQLEGTGICGAAVVSGIFSARNITQECRMLGSVIEEKILTKP